MERRNFIRNSSYFVIGANALGLLSCNDSTNPVLKKEEGFQLEEWTIDQLQNAYDDGSQTIEKVVQMYLNRIEAIDKNGPKLNSVIEVNPNALPIAKELDKELADGKKRGRMHGVPVIIKDNIDTGDNMMTTAGSRALIGSYAKEDAGVVKKLREAGAVIIAKANLSEWANFRGDNSSSGWSGRGGQTKNPYELDRNPCGSSSGSGASVSANLCMVAIGTETNGSIVCPSNANGVVGIKPTVGLVSRSGIIPISETQDTAGPMARTVADAAICLSAIAGSDDRDSYTTQADEKATDYSQFLKKDGLQGKRLGLFKSAMGFSKAVDRLIEQAIDQMKEVGAEIIDIERINSMNVGRESFDVLLYEFKDGLNKYFASLGEDAPIKSLEELIEWNKKDSIELSFYDQELLIQANEKGDLNSEEYITAKQKMLEAYREEGIDKVMDEHELDAIIAPTGSPAWYTDHINGDNFGGGSSSPAARSGYPNITVPAGFVDHLPIGISFFGKAWSEGALIELAYAYEQVSMNRKPPQFLD